MIIFGGFICLPHLVLIMQTNHKMSINDKGRCQIRPLESEILIMTCPRHMMDYVLVPDGSNKKQGPTFENMNRNKQQLCVWKNLKEKEKNIKREAQRRCCGGS